MNFILTWKKQETKNIQIREDRRPDSIDLKSKAELSTAIVEHPLDAEPRQISSIFSIFNLETLCLYSIILSGRKEVYNWKISQ